MITSAVRLLVARTMPHGLSEATAREVQCALESPRTTADPDRIDGMIAQAAASVPFYRHLGPRPLAELPVVDKTMMVAHLGDFLAEGADPRRLPTRMSSGSSGIPFTSYSDRARLTRHRAQLVAGYRYLGGDPFGALVHCRPWLHTTRRERVSYALRGQLLYSGEQDEETVRGVARWISRHRGTVLIGLCSFLENLLRAIEDHDIKLPAGSVGVVLGAGEPASRHLTEAVPRLTGVPLSRRYSSTELGILALDRGDDPHYRWDVSSSHVEILEMDSDLPAAPGGVGRIVVTDLTNRAMPFLRYDTGDLGRLALGEDGRPVPNLLAELVGRRSDVPLGGTVDAPARSSYFRLFMRVDQHEGIRQFQLRQHAIGHFTWVLNADPSAEVESLARGLLEEEIGNIRSCRIEYVPHLPLSQSGKARFFVSDIPDPEGLLEAAGR